MKPATIENLPALKRAIGQLLQVLAGLDERTVFILRDESGGEFRASNGVPVEVEGGSSLGDAALFAQSLSGGKKCFLLQLSAAEATEVLRQAVAAGVGPTEQLRRRMGL